MIELSTDKDKAKEKMLEAMLEYAGACHVENIIEELDKEVGLNQEIEYPVELGKKMGRIISRNRRRAAQQSFWKSVRKVLPKVAVILLIAMVSFGVLVNNVQAFKIRFFNFFFADESRYSSIDLKEKPIDKNIVDTSLIPSDWKDYYMPVYVPEGYKMTLASEVVQTKRIHYSNSNSQSILFIQYTGVPVNARLDSEEKGAKRILLSESEGILIENDDTITIMWNLNNIAFTIKGEAPKEELINMAKGIALK